MTNQTIAIQHTGLVTSVGLTAEASCAAFRAKISNPTETGFIDSGGEWLVAHQVPLERPWRGISRLTKMAVMAIQEAMADVPEREWAGIPLLLCIAEQERPGRVEGLDERLFSEIQQALGASFAPQSAVVPHGRVSVAIALRRARTLIRQENFSRVLIAATDSLVNWQTLSHYEHNDRLLTARNSNGFVPGEGAGAILVGEPYDDPQLILAGLGFGVEHAHIEADEPLRAEGLTTAIREALRDAGRELHDMDYRITDVSGEQYYFKEASLALGRILRRRKEDFEMWHPAECIGEIGAAAGLACIAMALMACRGEYAPGRAVLLHASADAGERTAIIASAP
jgi:3-oxoacyl-[acyl-carrier-protein] synthase-1